MGSSCSSHHCNMTMRTDRYWAWSQGGTTITFSSISAKTNERVPSDLNIDVAATLTSKTWMLHTRHKLYRWAPIQWWWMWLVHDRQGDGVLFLFSFFWIEWCDTKMRRPPLPTAVADSLGIMVWDNVKLWCHREVELWPEMKCHHISNICMICFMSESGSQRPLTIGSIKVLCAFDVSNHFILTAVSQKTVTCHQSCLHYEHIINH